MAVTASCPGRVCLVGEDLDWMGGHTVQAAIDLRVTVQAALQPAAGGRSSLRERVLIRDEGGKSPRYPYAGLAEFENAVQRVRGEITITSALPASGGLASSAAVLLAVLGAADAELAAGLSLDRLCDLAFRAERACGASVGPMDFVACARGGLVAMACEPPDWHVVGEYRLPMTFVVADSGRKHATGASIRRKSDLWEKGDRDVRNYQESTDALARELIDVIRVAASSRTVGQYLAAAHRLLRECMHVSTHELEDIVAEAERSGAYGAKLTGSGEGGCAFALCDDQSAPEILERIQLLGYRCWGSRLAAEGLIVRPA